MQTIIKPPANTTILLSIVVPVVNPKIYLKGLLDSIKELSSESIEIIFVNQSQQEIINIYDYSNINIKFIDRLTESIIPAARARNLGASIATGSYLLFLDDDAYFFPAITSEKITNLLTQLTRHQPDLLLLQRGETIDNNYKTHWPDPENKKIDYKNFSNYAIEWNFLIKQQLFNDLGGFIDIGPGSNHACLCGEAFVLFSKIIDVDQYSIELYPDIQIAHPGLFAKVVSLRNALAYYYATGYTVGIGLAYFKFEHRFYWCLRLIISVFYDLFLRNQLEIIPVQESVNNNAYRYALATCKLVGFIDSLRGKQPQPKDWLDLEAAKVART
jgi:glycosyltransferase involved in cell wall biosynthesis